MRVITRQIHDRVHRRERGPKTLHGVAGRVESHASNETVNLRSHASKVSPLEETMPCRLGRKPLLGGATIFDFNFVQIVLGITCTTEISIETNFADESTSCKVKLCLARITNNVAILPLTID